MRIFLSFVIVLLVQTVSIGDEANRDKPVKAVESVQLEKYIGLWYEIAKIPNRFQNSCYKNTTAFYELRKDGRINVINSCVKKDGSVIQAKGIARIADPSNAKLKVSFVRFLGVSLFWGDYWIIGLDEDYRYAVVGVPSRKYGWILSRTPVLEDEDLLHINNLLINQGYNPDDFIKTRHIQ